MVETGGGGGHSQQAAIMGSRGAYIGAPHADEHTAWTRPAAGDRGAPGPRTPAAAPAAGPRCRQPQAPLQHRPRLVCCRLHWPPPPPQPHLLRGRARARQTPAAARDRVQSVARRAQSLLPVPTHRPAAAGMACRTPDACGAGNYEPCSAAAGTARTLFDEMRSCGSAPATLPSSS